MTFNSNVVATVNQTTASSAAGSLNLTGTIDGSGGFTKNGDGMATLGTGDKTYTGPTVFNGGRTRISQAAHPQSTSSFRINAGAQVELITNGTYTFGPGTVFLNGTGASGGPQAQFPGAIRPTRATPTRTYTITNNVELESATLVHMQGFVVDDTSQTLEFSGPMSGGSTASLSISGLNSDRNLGRVLLSGANTYSGGSIVNGGRLEVSGASATFGTGDILLHNPFNVMVDGSDGKVGAISRLVIPSGVTNAIGDLATVTIESGSRAFADLGTGIDDTVGSLVLGGVTQTAAGTYGSMSSPADFKFADFFAGNGVLRLAASAAQPGDHNEDGKVDAADYVAWRKLPDSFGGDPGGYNAFKENFGEGGPGGGGAAGVPEPAALVTLGVALPLAMFLRRRES
jgi:autotransporter-associated beta strand protein